MTEGRRVRLGQLVRTPRGAIGRVTMIAGDLAYVFDPNRGYSEGFRIATLRPVPDASGPDNPHEQEEQS